MAKPTATPYREGKGWSVRLRIRGQDVYLSGLASATEAEQAVRRQRTAIENAGKPAHQGPQRTPLAVAMLDYARERLPFLKGAKQDARRINRYLLAAGQLIVQLTPVAPDDVAQAAPDREVTPVGIRRRGGRVRWTVQLVEAPAEPVIPKGLAAHRAAQAKRTERSDALRARLPCPLPPLPPPPGCANPASRLANKLLGLAPGWFVLCISLPFLQRRPMTAVVSSSQVNVSGRSARRSVSNTNCWPRGTTPVSCSGTALGRCHPPLLTAPVR